MSRDALGVLARLRRFEVDAAQRDLARRLRAVADAEAARHAAGMAIAREAAAATGPAAEAAMPAMFSHWLPHGQAAAEAASAARDAAEREVGHVRAALAVAHAAAEAVAVLRADRQRLARDAALRGEQAALDEHAARGRPGARHGLSAQ